MRIEIKDNETINKLHYMCTLNGFNFSKTSYVKYLIEKEYERIKETAKE